MAVPKHRKSKAKKRSRRASNDKRFLGSLSICPQCGAERMPHRICPECGFYKDRVIKAAKSQNEG